MAGRTPALAPGSPAPGPYAFSVQPSPAWPAPSWTISPGQNQNGLTVPVTKVVTLSLFVASLLGFVIIGLFVTFSFYRRRAWLRERIQAAEAARHICESDEQYGIHQLYSAHATSFLDRFQGVFMPAASEAEEQVRIREIPFLEGFIVANPCGSEQVAFMPEEKKEVELTQIVVDGQADPQRCSGSTTTASHECTPAQDSADRKFALRKKAFVAEIDLVPEVVLVEAAPSKVVQ